LIKLIYQDHPLIGGIEGTSGIWDLTTSPAGSVDDPDSGCDPSMPDSKDSHLNRMSLIKELDGESYGDIFFKSVTLPKAFPEINISV